ncbi:17652_t:CDS:2 [Entrophospora sp. SA101]|nr:17652_t:CDS:2 [Entrophospora sp. SA101]
MLVVPTIDCIEEILKNVNDKASLFSWTMVNSTWCSIAIPLLWSCPFSDLKWPQDHYKGHLLIRTYIACLPKDKKQHLIDEGYNMIDYYGEALFDYPSFLKELNIGNVQCSISQWWNDATDYRLRHKTKVPVLESAIFEMLFNNNYGLRSLDCRLQTCYNIPNFSSFKGIQRSISRLTELRIDCSSNDNEGYMIELIDVIIKNSQNIHVLVITPPPLPQQQYETDVLSSKLQTLIESQNNLEAIYTTLPYSGIFDPIRSASIFSALISQTDSITELDLRKMFIDWNSLEILAKCYNLKSLTLVNCHQEKDINNFFPLSEITATSIIMMARQNLKELVIDFVTPELSEFIRQQQIPNLDSLSIRTFRINELQQWLKQSKLVHLALSDVSNNSELFSLTNSYQLGKLLPETLNHLQIECRYNIAPESLTILLENSNCRNLQILSLDVEIFNDTLLEVVADYSRENGRILKELRIANDTLLEYDEKLRRKLSNVIPFINQNYIDTWPILSGEILYGKV